MIRPRKIKKDAIPSLELDVGKIIKKQNQTPCSSGNSSNQERDSESEMENDIYETVETDRDFIFLDEVPSIVMDDKMVQCSIGQEKLYTEKKLLFFQNKCKDQSKMIRYLK